MKYLFLFFFVFVFASIPVLSQDNGDRIEKIRNEYNKVKLEIDKITKDEEAAFESYLAVNELAVNKLNKSWPAAGNYSEVYRFYYKQAGEEPYPDHLVFVTLKTESAARTYYEEYLFDDSKKLMFAFKRNESGLERRAYFKKGIFLEYRGEPEKISSLTSSFASAAVERASRMQALFALSIQ